MPGNDNHHLDQLDFAALQSFIDTDVSGFLRKLDDIRSPDAHPTSLYDVSKKPQILAIGPMAGDDQTGGKNICANAQKAATAIDTVFSRHKAAFTKLQANLESVIKDMKQAQEHNLTEVKSQKFMHAISDYQTALGGGTGTGSGSGTGNGQNPLGL
ncbi:MULTISPECIES: type VII secretion system-associated protein [Streptomyces]|uniref:type VII secretion system-associated protein n=1 Tax=Streptomyces TaxID=1883 RepID=UPI0004BDCC15|nr:MULTISPECIES: type VII secretion system-associated protein [unclassified Streptomyces]MBG7700135.1 type VII secretion system-associated protein [Streptomyces sp. MC1]